MKKVNLILAFALALILAAICVVALMRSEHEKVPGGVARSGWEPNIPSLRKGKKGAQSSKTSRPLPKPKTKEEKVYARAREMIPEKIPESRTYNFHFSVAVFAEGRPVEGAHVRGELQAGNSGDFSFFGITEDPATDYHGYVKTYVWISKHTPGDTLVAVEAFHPEYGTDAKVLSLQELRSLGGEAIRLELELGHVIKGQVVDEHGNPIGRAAITLFGGGMKGEILVVGIGVYTKEDGTFKLPGIRFGTRPGSLLIAAKRRFTDLDEERIKEIKADPELWFKTRGKWVVKKEVSIRGLYREDQEVTDIGVVKVPIWSNSRLLQLPAGQAASGL